MKMSYKVLILGQNISDYSFHKLVEINVIFDNDRKLRLTTTWNLIVKNVSRKSTTNSERGKLVLALLMEADVW
jgi:hypothetical protein